LRITELDMPISSVSRRGPFADADVRLKRLIVDVLLIDDEDYRDEYGPDDIASWDSLATVRLAGAIEKEFGVTVPSDDMAAFNTIGDVKQFCRVNGIDL
jgi:acyl carrier protein